MKANLVWWCITKTWSDVSWVPVFKVKVTVLAQIFKKVCFFICPGLLNLLQPKLVHHHELECFVTILEFFVIKDKVTLRVQILREYLPGQYLLNHLTLLTHGMLVQNHDPECHAIRLGSYIQGHGHSAGTNPQKITFVHIT